MPLRLVFMGTPEFSVPTLLELVAHGHEIAAVYTRAPKPGGRRGLEPQATPIECEARIVGDLAVLSVADRGAGISPAHRNRVFDPFFSTKTRGTGLGLAVSKQIIDEHHGRIRLFNRRGGGTRVVIELPVG